MIERHLGVQLQHYWLILGRELPLLANLLLRQGPDGFKWDLVSREVQGFEDPILLAYELIKQTVGSVFCGVLVGDTRQARLPPLRFHSRLGNVALAHDSFLSLL